MVLNIISIGKHRWSHLVDIPNLLDHGTDLPTVEPVGPTYVDGHLFESPEKKTELKVFNQPISKDDYLKAHQLTAKQKQSDKTDDAMSTMGIDDEETEEEKTDDDAGFKKASTPKCLNKRTLAIHKKENPNNSSTEDEGDEDNEDEEDDDEKLNNKDEIKEGDKKMPAKEGDGSEQNEKEKIKEGDKKMPAKKSKKKVPIPRVPLFGVKEHDKPRTYIDQRILHQIEHYQRRKYARLQEKRPQSGKRIV